MGHLQKCKTASSGEIDGLGVNGVSSPAPTEVDWVTDTSDSWSVWLLEERLGSSGLSDAEGAGEMERELVALLVEDVVRSDSSLGGRLPHSR